MSSLKKGEKNIKQNDSRKFIIVITQPALTFLGPKAKIKDEAISCRTYKDNNVEAAPKNLKIFGS